MRERAITLALVAAVALVAAGCRDSGGSGDAGRPDTALPDGSTDLPVGDLPVGDVPPTDLPVGDVPPTDSPTDSPAGMCPTTIANLRQHQPTADTEICIEQAVVIGKAGNNKLIYLMDPAGGEWSGIAVYCDYRRGEPPCADRDALPGRETAVSVQGTFDVYRGKLEIMPSRIDVLRTVIPIPPPNPVTAAELAYTAPPATRVHGTLVTVSGGPFTVTNVEPAALLNPAYAGPDAGEPDCSAGPRYFGFEVSDGTSTFYVLTSFYRTMHLATDPACTRPEDDSIMVTNGMTFTRLGGIADMDNGAQALLPVTDDDYELGH